MSACWCWPWLGGIGAGRRVELTHVRCFLGGFLCVGVHATYVARSLLAWIRASDGNIYVHSLGSLDAINVLASCKGASAFCVCTSGPPYRLAAVIKKRIIVLEWFSNDWVYNKVRAKRAQESRGEMGFFLAYVGRSRRECLVWR